MQMKCVENLALSYKFPTCTNSKFSSSVNPHAYPPPREATVQIVQCHVYNILDLYITCYTSVTTDWQWIYRIAGNIEIWRFGGRGSDRQI